MASFAPMVRRAASRQLVSGALRFAPTFASHSSYVRLRTALSFAIKTPLHCIPKATVMGKPEKDSASWECFGPFVNIPVFVGASVLSLVFHVQPKH